MPIISACTDTNSLAFAVASAKQSVPLCHFTSSNAVGDSLGRDVGNGFRTDDVVNSSAVSGGIFCLFGDTLAGSSEGIS